VRYTALDSWRGLCAVMVALYHLPIDAALLKFGLVRQGYLFVDFFFVLSGFVIMHSYGTKIRSGADAAAFLIKRWGRVWPLHVVLLAVFVVLEFVKAVAIQHGVLQGSAFSGGNNLTSILTNLLLVHSWGMHDGIFWNFPSWSISTEWAAYLFFAAVLLVGKRVYLTLVIVVGLLCAVLGMYFSPDTIDMTYNYGVLRCISAFSLGILVHAAHKRVAVPVAMATVLEVAAVIVLAGALTVFGYGAATHVMPLVFGLVVFVFAGGAGAISQALTIRPLQKLGNYSYSVYMNHALLIFVLTSAGVILSKLTHTAAFAMVGKQLTFSSPFAAHVTIVGYVLVLVSLSALTYRWIELPGQSYFKKRALRLTSQMHPIITA
jgi:peptidoglycan/LPS O-acetylase OafA/YrhL